MSSIAESVQPKRAPIIAAKVPGHEVPAAPGGDHLVGFDEATTVLVVAPSIVEAHLLVISACAGEYGEGVGVEEREGDEKTTAPYRTNPAVELHGPGRSKIIIGPDVAAEVPESRIAELARGVIESRARADTFDHPESRGEK